MMNPLRSPDPLQFRFPLLFPFSNHVPISLIYLKKELIFALKYGFREFDCFQLLFYAAIHHVCSHHSRRPLLEGVYMGKLAPARVSYRDDFVITWWLGHFIPCWIDKKYACATRSSLPANRFHTETSGLFAFTWYRCEISYRSEMLAPVRVPGCTHSWVLWWYHVNKCIAMRGNRSELVPARKSPRCHVNTSLQSCNSANFSYFCFQLAIYQLCRYSWTVSCIHLVIYTYV